MENDGTSQKQRQIHTDKPAQQYDVSDRRNSTKQHKSITMGQSKNNGDARKKDASTSHRDNTQVLSECENISNVRSAEVCTELPQQLGKDDTATQKDSDSYDGMVHNNNQETAAANNASKKVKHNSINPRSDKQIADSMEEADVSAQEQQLSGDKGARNGEKYIGTDKSVTVSNKERSQDKTHGMLQDDSSKAQSQVQEGSVDDCLCKKGQ